MINSKANASYKNQNLLRSFLNKAIESLNIYDKIIIYMEQRDSENFFWQTYEKLPDSLKEALFSEENFNIISKICKDSGVTDEEAKSLMMKYVGKVLMGLLPIKEFPIMLELDLNLDSEKARNIATDIDRQIFSRLRIELNKLYLENIAEKKDLSDNIKKEGPVKPKEGEKTTGIPKPPAPKNKDTYREPVI